LSVSDDRADPAAPSADPTIEFAVDPAAYRHWSLAVDGPVATLTLAVDPSAGIRPGDYELKLNSYDLGVDIELYDIVQRLRFEHPTVKAVVVTGGLDKVFCAGANIQMLATSTHQHKVNFCKFTNETRNSLENASEASGQTWIAAVNGTAAGGGYELALACAEILLVDDRASAVSLPEVPLLAVLPGTGGLTRVVDKRHVRRDLADAFATRTEGIRGQQAVEWNLVDHIAPASKFPELLAARTAHYVAASDRPDDAQGVTLTPLARNAEPDSFEYSHVTVTIDRQLGTATITVAAPPDATTPSPADLESQGAAAWLLAAARQLDDALLHLRFNERTIGTWVLKTTGSPDAVLAHERALAPAPAGAADHWLVREIRLYWQRVFKRLELSARSIVTLIEPGSCFAGMLAELAFAGDRIYMLDGTWEDGDAEPATLLVSDANVVGDTGGWFPMSNGLTRLETRFWGRPDALARATELAGKDLAAADALQAELITFALDDIDWDDEIRMFLEERASFSPDALTGMEANYRFVGPETMETKIFARLSAWQNWIFQRPNAVGPDGALRRFGTGSRPTYQEERV
jgi:benzoyl-CoA-dihydrodiol lyase